MAYCKTKKEGNKNGTSRDQKRDLKDLIKCEMSIHKRGDIIELSL